jgi:hypothetical protein
MGEFSLPIDLLDRTTIEVPCPIPDCGSIVYAPSDNDNVRIDCLDCGAALLTRSGIDGAVTLEVTEDAVITVNHNVPPPRLGAGCHIVAFDASTSDDDFFPFTLKIAAASEKRTPYGPLGKVSKGTKP